MSNPIYSIYKISRARNGKCYIGFTSNFPKRLDEHRHSANSTRPTKKVLYKAIRKYGWDSFIKEILYCSADYSHTKTMEEFFIIDNNSHYLSGNGYNMTYGGEGEKGNKSRTGMPHSQSSILKCSENRKGKGMGERNSMKRPEIANKIRLSKLGKKRTYRENGSWFYS